MTDDARGVYAADETVPSESFSEAPPVGETASPQYGVGPFSVREVVLGGIWLVAFILSFIPVFGGSSLWGLGLTWVLAIGVPTAAVFLLVLRRLSPDGIRRVGSLGIDQFASVAFTVAAVYWLTLVWQQVSVAVNTGMSSRGGWLIWVEFILMLAGVVFTVFAPLLPVFGEDFRHRPESLAHPNARRLRPVAPRPARPARPARQVPVQTVGEPAPATNAPGAAYTPGEGYAVDTAGSMSPVTERAAVDETAETSVFERLDLEPELDGPASYADIDDADTHVADIDAADTHIADSGAADIDAADSGAEAAPRGEAHQAFWALAPDDRDVLDASGAPIFQVGPTAWALVIEDRGEVFVVRHEDGRIGYLHEVSGVTRG